MPTWLHLSMIFCFVWAVESKYEVCERDTSSGFVTDVDVLQAYSNNLVDHHLILDLLPFLARAFFARRLPAPMSYGQAAILASLGLQQREVSDCEKDLNLPSSQVLALFNKVSKSAQCWQQSERLLLVAQCPGSVSQGTCEAQRITIVHAVQAVRKLHMHLRAVKEPAFERMLPEGQKFIGQFCLN